MLNTRFWTKKETQETIKDLRAAGYVIQKPNGIYKIMDEQGQPWIKDYKPMFSAMVGMSGYLVQFHDDLFNSVTIKGD
jgi:hypothetical protein